MILIFCCLLYWFSSKLNLHLLLDEFWFAPFSLLWTKFFEICNIILAYDETEIVWGFLSCFKSCWAEICWACTCVGLETLFALLWTNSFEICNIILAYDKTEIVWGFWTQDLLFLNFWYFAAYYAACPACLLQFSCLIYLAACYAACPAVCCSLLALFVNQVSPLWFANYEPLGQWLSKDCMRP